MAIYSTEHLAGKLGKKTEEKSAPETSALTPLWEKHRDLMRHLTLGVDIAYLHNLPDWERASSVLEIGCGKGRFLESLLDYFPEKEYVGIDFLKKTKTEDETSSSSRPGTINIINAPIYAVGKSHYEKYDIIFIHSLAREIPQAKQFMRQVYRFLKPGGTLIIYEMNDENIYFRPEQGFAAFFEELPALKAALPGSHGNAKDLLRAASQSGLNLKTDRDVLFPSSYGDNKRHLSKIVSQLLEIAEKSDEMEWNFATARRSLQRWTSDPSSFGQFAIRRVVMRRPGGLFRRLLRFLLPF